MKKQEMPIKAGKQSGYCIAANLRSGKHQKLPNATGEEAILEIFPGCAMLWPGTLVHQLGRHFAAKVGGNSACLGGLLAVRKVSVASALTRGYVTQLLAGLK